MKIWADRSRVCMVGVAAVFMTFLLLLWQNSGIKYPEVAGNELVREHLRQNQLNIWNDRMVNADGLIAVGAIFAANACYPAAEYRLRLAVDLAGSAKAALILAGMQYNGVPDRKNLQAAEFWAERTLSLAEDPETPNIHNRARKLLESIRTTHEKEKNN